MQEEEEEQEIENLCVKIMKEALAGVAQWTECQPVNQGVTGSIPSRGTCLGCEPGRLVWGMSEATTH